MIRMPAHRTLFAVDVIKSAQVPARQLHEVPHIVDDLITSGLAACGIERPVVVDREHTGDGAILSLPDDLLAVVVDATHRIDELARRRNEAYKPEIRLRMALHTGFVAESDGFQQPKIDLARLLEAQAFRDILQRCAADFPSGTFNSGLIMSDRAYGSVFAGPYTSLVDQHEFTRIDVAVKEYQATAWVRVPGAGHSAVATREEQAGNQTDPAGSRNIVSHGAVGGHQISGDNNVVGATTHNALNSAGGNVNGIQAGIIRGDVSIGRS